VRGCVAAGLPLVVAGDGPELEALRAAAAGHDVTFTGRISPEALAELRTRAALAIVPFRYAEILPLVALEAMAAGLPVVAAAAGGLAVGARLRAIYARAESAGRRRLNCRGTRSSPASSSRRW